MPPCPSTKSSNDVLNHSCVGVAVGFVGQAVEDGAAVTLFAVADDPVAAERLAHIPAGKKL